MKKPNYYGLPFIFLCIIILLLSEFFHSVMPVLVPTPLGTLKALWFKRELILYHLPYTLAIAFGGIALSLVVSFILVVSMQLVGFLEKAMLPALIISQAIPFIALGPLLLAIFGYGITTKIAVTALLCYFPIFLSLYEGMSQVNQSQLKVLVSLGLSPYQIIMHLRLPNALPSLFTGIRTSLSWVFSAAILSELLGTYRGLGFLIKAATRSFDSELIFAIIVVITIFSLLFFMLAKWCEASLMPWNKKVGDKFTF
ncbi:MAG: ABC transporter permease [Alphaproteobacteria bacterium]